MQLIEKSPLVLDYLARLGAKDTYKAKFESLMQAVDAAPAVEAVPVRHGRWEKGGYACGETEWKCSVCGETEWRTSCSRMKFCMFCGAKMDLEEKEE